MKMPSCLSKCKAGIGAFRVKGKTVWLERFALKHVSDEYIRWLNDPEVCRYNSHGEVRYTRKKALEYLRSIRCDSHKYVFAIIDDATGCHVGNIGLYVSSRDRSGEIAILIGRKDFWGRGIGTDAYRLVIRLAFQRFGLHRVWSGMLSRNRAMTRLVEKLNFKREGVFRDAFCKRGRYYDEEVWSLLNR
jgi:RimJ/RimL family protein N-acetyltransferase